MANETIEQDNLNFGIQDTMDMGMGNQDLLNDILAPETSTADLTKLKDINTEEEEIVVPAKKPIVPKTVTETTTIVDNNLDGFLNDDGEEEEEEEEEEEIIPGKKPLGSAPPKKKEGAEEEEENGTPFEAIANELFNLGVFNKEEGEEVDPITTPEAFLERFNIEKKKEAIVMVDNFIAQFGQDYQDAFDAIFVKGLNPRDYFHAANNIGNFSELDLTIESNQEKVVRQALTDQGFDQEDVDSEVERLKNYGDLESVSQKHHKVLLKKETESLAQKTKEAQLKQQQKQNVKQTYINNVNHVLENKIKEKGFDGIPMNPKIANELQDFLLVDKWKTESGETLTDFDKYVLELKLPENHEKKVKVGLLLKLLEKDPTLSTIQKSGVTKKTDTLFKEISRQVLNTGTKKSGEPTPKSWFQTQ